MAAPASRCPAGLSSLQPSSAASALQRAHRDKARAALARRHKLSPAPRATGCGSRNVKSCGAAAVLGHCTSLPVAWTGSKRPSSSSSSSSTHPEACRKSPRPASCCRGPCWPQLSPPLLLSCHFPRLAATFPLPQGSHHCRSLRS